jgi:hypothetical protein
MSVFLLPSNFKGLTVDGGISIVILLVWLPVSFLVGPVL